MRQNRDFHRQVRVVYRACRRLYGKERTQDECLRVFKVVFPELYRLRNSTDEFVDVPRKISDGILKVTHDWNPHGALSGVISHAIGKLQRSLDWKREELMQFYEDIMPVVMRIRKLTPRECYRLQGVNEEKINVERGICQGPKRATFLVLIFFFSKSIWLLNIKFVLLHRIWDYS